MSIVPFTRGWVFTHLTSPRGSRSVSCRISVSRTKPHGKTPPGPPLKWGVLLIMTQLHSLQSGWLASPRAHLLSPSPREGAGSRLLPLLTSKEVDSSPTPEQTQVLRPVKAWLNFTMECRLPRSRNQLRGAPAVRAKSQCAIEGVDAPCCSEARLKCWDDRPAF